MHHHGRQLEDRSGQKETAWLVADGSAVPATQGIGIGMGIRILPSCDALRTTAPRQWLAPSCSNPEYAGCRIRRGFRFRCSVLGCPGCAAGRARHLWRLSAVSTGFPFLGQRGAHIIPNRVRMRVENLFIALPISIHLPPQNHG